jgi:hypothetical protein
MNEWGARKPEDLVSDGLETLARRDGHGNERPVLVLDQFEDVFKTLRERNRLWDRLAQVVNVTEGPAHVLISMREEWLGAWQEAEDYLPDALASLIRLRPLSPNEVQRAILEPVEREGTLQLDPDLAKRLASDLRRPSPYGALGLQVEPGLLQLVCRRLWSLAKARNLSVIPLALYDELGGADSIIREFVWNELGSAGMDTKEIDDPERPKPTFTAPDRVLWVGLTRHLIAAHGVKSSVSVEMLARTLTLPDLGIAGPAVAERAVGQAGMRYLESPPEKRGGPPMDVGSWLSGVLGKAVDVGFMKRQLRSLEGAANGNGSSPDRSKLDRHIYELSHDGLADILQGFKIEFEGWVRIRLAKLVGAVVAAIAIVPLLLFIATLTFKDVIDLLQGLFIVGIGGILYAISLFIMGYIFRLLGRLLLHPIYRRLVHGRVPLKLIRR